MANMKLKLNRSGVRDLLQSHAMQKVCIEHAQRIQTRCGNGYEIDSRVGRNRVNAMVYASTPEALRDNAANNTILKAVK